MMEISSRQLETRGALADIAFKGGGGGESL
jgi:hypothetical protein